MSSQPHSIGECLCCICDKISGLESGQTLIIKELKEIKEMLKCDCDCKDKDKEPKD